MKFFKNIPDDLFEIAPHGLAMGIGTFQTGDIDVFTSYSEDWQSLYSKNRWLLIDPAVTSSLSGPGCRPWKAETSTGTEFKEACSGFGLNSGISITTSIAGSSCVTGLTTNKPLTSAAIEAAKQAVRTAHMGYLTRKAQSLSAHQIDVVYLFANGYRAKEVSNILDISEETVKQRKLLIQRHLGVNNFLATVNICALAGQTIHPIK